MLRTEVDEGSFRRFAELCRPKVTVYCAQLIFKYITLFAKVSNHLGLIYPGAFALPSQR